MAQKMLTNFTPPGSSDSYKFRAGGLFFGTTSNSTSAMTVSIPGVTEYYTGLTLILTMGAQPASGCTLNVNSLGAKSMVYGASQSGTYFASGATYLFVYDGTNFKAVHSYNSNTTYSAEKGITLSSGKFGHTNSITAKTTYNQNTASPGYGGTFKITEPKYDAYGHITGVQVATITMPNAITASDLGLSNALHFIGVKDAIPTTGTYANGDVILVGNKEYVYSGGSWIELGDESSFSLKGHTHTVTYAKSATATGSTTQGGTNAETSITPAGTVSQPTFTGTAHNHTFTGTAHGHTFTGSSHNHTLSPSTTDVYSITSVGTMFSASVSGEVLTLTPGTAPTRSSAIKAYTGLTIAAATQGGTISNTTATGSIGNTTATGTVSKPTFTGTAAKHTHTFTGSAHTHAITLTNTTVTSST